jgi:ATP/maltotriose-dependent transcriptional regulator MalT
MSHAAVIDRERGAPDDALKLYQLAQMRLLNVSGDHPWTQASHALLHLVSALAFALLDRPDKARRELLRAADYPEQDDPFERADLDDVRASIELALGRVNAAEQYATRSVRTWSPDDRRDSAIARITLATTHAIAGERDTPRLAGAAIDAVSGLRSARGRVLLVSLDCYALLREDRQE